MPKIAYSVRLVSGERVAFSLRKKDARSPFWNVRWRWKGRFYVRSTRKSHREEAEAEGRRIVFSICGGEPVEATASAWFDDANAEINRLARAGQLSQDAASEVLSLARFLCDVGVPPPIVQRSIADVRLVWSNNTRRVAVDVGLWLRVSVEDRVGRMNVEWTQAREATVRHLAAFLRSVFGGDG